MDALSQETIAILGVGVVLAGFFWSLHRDMAALRERLSRLEALYEGLRDAVNHLAQRFDRLEQRVGGLEQRVVGLDQRVVALDQRVVGLERRFDEQFPPPPAADD